jgi:peptide/nickel transport system substrate-binding protein
VTRENSLLSGELDLIWTSDTQSVINLEAAGMQVTQGQIGAMVRTVVPDSADPASPWSSVEVRQAAQLAIDRDAIVAAVFSDKALAAEQLAYPGNLAFDSKLAAVQTDLDEARELLEDAGFPDGFSTTITYGVSAVNDKVYQSVQAQLAEIGIDAQLNPVQSQAFAEYTSAGLGWDGLVMGQAAPSPDFLAGLNRFYNGSGGNAFTEYAVPSEYSDLLKAGLSASTAEEKAENARALVAQVTDEALLLLVYGQYEFAIAAPNVAESGALFSPYTMQWTPEAVRLRG